jgi:hypothetical protein
MGMEWGRYTGCAATVCSCRWRAWRETINASARPVSACRPAMSTGHAQPLTQTGLTGKAAHVVVAGEIPRLQSASSQLHFATRPGVDFIFAIAVYKPVRNRSAHMARTWHPRSCTPSYRQACQTPLQHPPKNACSAPSSLEDDCQKIAWAL